MADLHADPPFPLPAPVVHLARVAFSAAGLSLTIAFGAVYAITVGHLSVPQLLALGLALELTILLSEVPTGVLADAYSRRLSVLIGMAGIGAGILLPVAWPQFWAFLAGQAIWGLSYTFVSGAGDAWLVDEVGQDAARPVFRREETLYLAVSVVGIILGGVVAWWSLRTAVGLSGGFYVLGALVLGMTMTERHFRPTPRGERSTWSHLGESLRQGLTVARRSRVVLVFVAASVLVGLASEGVDRLWHKQVMNHFHLPTVEWLNRLAPDGDSTAVWFALFALAMTVIALLSTLTAQRWLPDRWITDHPHLIMATLALCEVTAVAGLALSGSLWWFLAALWLRRALIHIAAPVEKSWLNTEIPSATRASVLSIVSQARAVGEVGGGATMVGVSSLGVTIRGIFTLCALFIAPTVVLYAITRRGTDR